MSFYTARHGAVRSSSASMWFSVGAELFQRLSESAESSRGHAAAGGGLSGRLQ